MLETILIAVALVVVGVNVATTVSPRFRRWVYSQEKQ
jgi:Flp pilus assembly pilin Flp